MHVCELPGRNDEIASVTKRSERSKDGWLNRRNGREDSDDEAAPGRGKKPSRTAFHNDANDRTRELQIDAT